MYHSNKLRKKTSWTDGKNPRQLLNARTVSSLNLRPSVIKTKLSSLTWKIVLKTQKASSSSLPFFFKHMNPFSRMHRDWWAPTWTRSRTSRKLCSRANQMFTGMAKVHTGESITRSHLYHCGLAGEATGSTCARVKSRILYFEVQHKCSSGHVWVRFESISLSLPPQLR